MSQLRWGILSTGWIAETQTADLQIAGLKVQAVGSRTIEAANEFADRFNIPNRHASYQDLVEDTEVDIIYIGTPHPWHFENAMQAIEAGKHVLLEKPFTINAGQAQKIADAAKANNVFVMEAMWTRFLPMMVRVNEIVQSGLLGTTRVILADHNQYIPRERAARLHEPELGGGALLDLGIYPISFASRFMGTPSAITAKATLTDLKVDELTAIIFEYPDGSQASMHTGFMAQGPNTASLIGTKGRINIDSVWYNQTSFTVYDNFDNVIERYEDKIDGRGMQYQALEVERCIQAGQLESSIMPLGETIEIMKMMDEIRTQIGVKYAGE